MSEQAELLKQGIAISGGDYRYNVVYEFTGLNDVKPQMIEEATKMPVPLPKSLQKTQTVAWVRYGMLRRDNSPYRTEMPIRLILKVYG